MHCTRMLTLRKTLLSLTSNCIRDYKFVRSRNIDLLTRPQFRQFYNNVHLRNIPLSLIKSTSPNGIFEKLSYRIALRKRKYQLVALGYQLYDAIPDQLNYSVFFQEFNMPDTFFSWFVVTELHVWMLMVRFMAEGEIGKIVITNIVEAMWHDVLVRVDLLGPIPQSLKKKQIMQLSDQFNAGIIGYDEGIMADDKVLAGALWRRFFGLECNNPEHLEKLVLYVRKQISIFDHIPSEQLYHRSIAQWDLRCLK